MPAYRGRVETVRQRPDEGGTNFFMESGTIASLALRGAFAGARLRRHFDLASPHRYWWNRHRWMRLRIVAHNFEELRRGARMADADPLFQTMQLIRPRPSGSWTGSSRPRRRARTALESRTTRTDRTSGSAPHPGRRRSGPDSRPCGSCARLRP
jgi:hypothetical protein